jgi:hypothetical protein
MGDLDNIEEVACSLFQINETRLDVTHHRNAAMKTSVDAKCPNFMVDQALSEIMSRLESPLDDYDDEFLTKVDGAILAYENDSRPGKKLKKCPESLRKKYTMLDKSIKAYLTIVSYLRLEIRLVKSITLREMEEKMSMQQDLAKFLDVISLIPTNELNYNFTIFEVIETYIKTWLREDPEQGVKAIEVLIGDMVHSKWKEKYAQAESVPGNKSFFKCSDDEMRQFLLENEGKLYVFEKEKRRSTGVRILKAFLLAESCSENLADVDERMLFQLGLFFLASTAFREKVGKVVIPVEKLCREMLILRNEYPEKKINEVVSLIVDKAKDGLSAFKNDHIFLRPSLSSRNLIGTHINLVKDNILDFTIYGESSTNSNDSEECSTDSSNSDDK